jgi:hypothetical protein
MKVIRENKLDLPINVHDQLPPGKSGLGAQRYSGNLPPALRWKFNQVARFVVDIKAEVKMISPVTSSSTSASDAAQVRNAAPAAKPPANPPQDKVQLSPQASAGDVDHDGDSH